MWNRRLLLTVPLLIVVPLLPLFGADEAEQRRKLEKLRTTNPSHYARLRQETLALLALPPARREQMIKFDQELHNEPSATQKHLVEVLQRYANWLEQLPDDKRREVLEMKDRAKQLQLIRRLREHQWLRSQPRAIQAKVERLRKWRPMLLATRVLGPFAAPRNVSLLSGLSALASVHGDAAADFIARVKLDEKKRRQEWQIAARHWDKLIDPPKEGLPNRAIHFGKEVDRYVHDYLRHLLSKAEWERLKAAEGKWPEYPYVLVELADRHPLALPGPRGIDTVRNLPEEVKKALAAALFKGAPKQIDKALLNRIFKSVEGHWPQFGTAAATFAFQKKVTLPVELWPTKPRDLSPPMQRFLKENLTPPLLARDEDLDLKSKEGGWPDYPNKIQELANKYHLQPPWQTLPELPDPRKRLDWDDYRLKQRAHLDGLPELPKNTLRDFALLELTPAERAALKLSFDDPGSWHRLTARYFQDKPGELKRLRQTDVQHLRKHGNRLLPGTPVYLGPAPRGGF